MKLRIGKMKTPVGSVWAITGGAVNTNDWAELRSVIVYLCALNEGER